MHLLIYVNALDLLHGKTLSRRDLRVLPYQKRLQDCSDFIDGSNSIWLYKERNFKNILTFPRTPESLANLLSVAVLLIGVSRSCRQNQTCDWQNQPDPYMSICDYIVCLFLADEALSSFSEFWPSQHQNPFLKAGRSVAMGHFCWNMCHLSSTRTRSSSY